MVNRSFPHSPFKIHSSSAREIHAADFADRVVHRWLVPRQALRATLASYLGHFQHASARRLTRSLWRHYPWLGLLFSPQGRPFPLVPRFEPATVSSLRGQWRFFAAAFPDRLILIQVGNRVEAYGEHARVLAREFGVRPDRAPRSGFEESVGLPLQRLKGVRRTLCRRATAHLFVAEEGWLKGGMKRRVLRLLWQPDEKRTGARPVSTN